MLKKVQKLLSNKAVDFLVGVGGYDRDIMEMDEINVVFLDNIKYNKLNNIIEYQYFITYYNNLDDEFCTTILEITVDKNNKVIGCDFSGCNLHSGFKSHTEAENSLKVNS